MIAVARDEWHYGSPGAAPIERIQLLDSEVHHLRERVAEDRSDREELDKRLRTVEVVVGHVDRVVKWGFVVLGGLVLTVGGAVLAAVFHQGR